MKITNKIFKTVTAVFLILSAVLGYFRINMLNCGKIDELGLYTDRASGNIFNGAVFILLAFVVAFVFMLSKSSFTERKTNVFTVLSSILCSLLLITFAISGIHEMLSTPSDILSAQPANKLDIFLVLEVVLALASLAFFVSEVLKSNEAGDKNKLLALIPVLFIAVRTIDMFMDITTQINSSSRAFTTLFLAVIMMFFISEAELGVPLAPSEKTPAADSKRLAKYIGFGTASGILAVIFIIAPIFAEAHSLSEIIVSVLDITLALFAVIRVFSVKPE